MIHPPAVLSQFLTERRAAGEAFEDMWPDAVQLALADVRDPVEAIQWRRALEQTVGACGKRATSADP